MWSVRTTNDSNIILRTYFLFQIPNSRLTRGFSSFKFVPSSNDFVIVALRTEELEGNTSTYITAFTIKGVVLLDDVFIENIKYEGFEFI